MHNVLREIRMCVLIGVLLLKVFTFYEISHYLMHFVLVSSHPISVWLLSPFTHPPVVLLIQPDVYTAPDLRGMTPGMLLVSLHPIPGWIFGAFIWPWVLVLFGGEREDCLTPKNASTVAA